MADEAQDKSSQTEEPTEKKQSDARQKGNTPNSREAGTFLSLLAAFVVVAGIGPFVMSQLADAMVPLIERPEGLIEGTDVGDLTQMIGHFILETGSALAPVFVILVLAGLVAAFAQGHVVMTPERIRPKLERLSIPNGFKRMFGLSAAIEFANGLTKITIVGAITASVLWPAFARAESLVFTDVSALPGIIKEFTVRLLVAVAAAMSLIAALDLIWRRFDWRRNLRMSPREIKDEMKQVEGDPMIKARLREIRRQRARRRMLEAVPTATVVVMNPTHYAVALRYERGADPVPVCVAKGLDLIALRIREVAEANGIAVVEDPPLARALHAALDVDQPIAKEFYRAVAELISYVFSQNEARARTSGSRLPPLSDTMPDRAHVPS